MSINPTPEGGRRDNRADRRGAETPPAESAWSLRVATVSGIPIRLHFTFLLLIIWLAVSGIGNGGAGMVLVVLGLFFCIALHELGHSLVAQRYGYGVRDITLYPIGGVAAIEGSPTPRHELFIALAGPMVNVAIAAVLGTILLVLGRIPDAQTAEAMMRLVESDPLLFLLSANITLVVFNMIPAFPMDGGRVLRALLGMKLGKGRATQIAARVGQFMAVLMGLYGLGVFNGRQHLGLMLIALFVFFGANQEVQVETTRDIVEDAPVKAAMIREFQTLQTGDTLRRAAETLLETTQQDFPVLFGDEVMGVLTRAQLLQGLAREGDGAYVSEVMLRDVLIATEDEPLEDYMLSPDGVQRAPVLVNDAAGRLVGMLTVDNLMEYLTLRQIARNREEARHAGPGPR
jgi:Zn-dependent protease/CBS domain-containing protein